jgi:hypothetical protein
MRIFLVLICSLALACLASGAQEEKKENKPAPKKKGAPAGQVSQPAGKTYSKPAGAGKPTYAGKPAGKGKPAEVGKPTYAGKPTGVGKPTGAGKPTEVSKPTGKGKPAETGKPLYTGKPAGKGKPTEAATTTATGKPIPTGKTTAKGKPFKPQSFKLASKSKPATSVAPAVTFQQNRRIEGSQNWQGSNYSVFRDYSSTWHDRDWWRHNHSRIVFVFGGWYAWNAGYWYPAWGYDPNAYYAYDGPIYGYNDLPPDQVIANVQAALQEQGYYRGEVDGLLGPLTRGAIADYQRDHGLYITSAIDRPTLASLGMV